MRRVVKPPWTFDLNFSNEITRMARNSCQESVAHRSRWALNRRQLHVWKESDPSSFFIPGLLTQEPWCATWSKDQILDISIIIEPYKASWSSFRKMVTAGDVGWYRLVQKLWPNWMEMVWTQPWALSGLYRQKIQHRLPNPGGKLGPWWPRNGTFAMRIKKQLYPFEIDNDLFSLNSQSHHESKSLYWFLLQVRAELIGQFMSLSAENLLFWICL